LIHSKTTALACIIALASEAAAWGMALAASPAHVPLPRPRPPLSSAAFPTTTGAASHTSAARTWPSAPKAPKDESGVPFGNAAFVQKSDLDAVKEALDLVRRAKTEQAAEVQHRIQDPLARKVVEWAILRSDDNTADSFRYHDFIAANPGWPSVGLFRRRAEAMLWQEHAVLANIRTVTADRPLTGKGKFALGRALLERGDRDGAKAAIRDAWRTEPLPRDAEQQVLATFGDLISPADEKARMDTKLYANDNETGSRAAQRLGGDAPAIAKMRVAFNQKAANAHELLEALPDSAKDDPLVIFSRIQDLRRADKIPEAAALLASAPRDPAVIVDEDEWWVERRLVARRMLDLDDARTAYQIVRDAATPAKENYRIDREFTAGWIALRFLKDPALAAQHFARMTQGVTNPISLARAGYWRGRAAEAAGRPQEARSYYEAAARYSTAYYGQIARAKLGMTDVPLAPLPLPAPPKRAALAQIEVVRAAEILYAVGERDLIVPMMADLGERTTDAGTLAALAELAAHNNDARSAMLVGKTALGRGYAFDRYAFPTFGLPRYAPIAPEVERAVVYAIARQESAFNPRDVSRANALGLMQVTPEAGQHIARKFNVRYDQRRLMNDDIYNVQIGAAELYENISSYHGSFILAFAGYNAGRGRVKEWIDKYGDPREPGVDPIDWVERIPFAETRNYVQRVMENIQVYRARFAGGSSKLQIEADLHRGTAVN
jgi:soluble lytic murein transglycosylase